MSDPAGKRGGLIPLLCVAALALTTFIDLHRSRAEDPFGVVIENRNGEPTVVYMRDFPAHLRFARFVTSGQARVLGARQEPPESAYSKYSHRRILIDWLGVEHSDRALPFGYSPTMLYVLGPLTPLPDAWAFAVWTLLGWAAAWWMCRSASPIAALVILASPLAARCQWFGQTAILSTAGLLFLMLESRRDRTSVMAMALVLWALTAKPPLALAAGAALLSQRQWRPVAYAVALAAITTALAWPLLGRGWVTDYLDMLGHYNLVTADPLYRWCLMPDYMCNLRSVLSIYLRVPDDLSSRIALLLWLPALALVAWRGSWRSAVLVMLLLTPHVNSTENLALLAVAGASPWPVAALACAAVWANGYALPVGWLWPLPAFLLQVALLVAVLLTEPSGERK